MLKATHYDWRNAQKLAVNISSTQTDCQTSDKVFTVLFRWRHFLLLLFWHNVFQHEKSLGGRAKISITLSYIRIIKWHLGVKCR